VSRMRDVLAITGALLLACGHGDSQPGDAGVAAGMQDAVADDGSVDGATACGTLVCDAAADAVPPPQTCRDGIDIPGTELAITGSTPVGDVSEFTRACIQAFGWGECTGGRVEIRMFRQSTAAFFTIEIEFDGAMDEVAVARPCTLRIDDTTAPCAFVGALRWDGGPECSGRYMVLPVRGELSAMEGGFEFTAVMELAICDVGICI